MATKKFKYVLIPASADEPIKEFEYVQAPTIEQCDFTQSLVPHFAKRGKVNKEIFQSQISKKISSDVKLTDEQMEAMATQTRVEIVPLVLPIKETKFLSISMYVDDSGIAKQLPRNVRAHEISKACGHSVDVRGDAFLGRIFDDQDKWLRIDFSTKDLTSDAEWMTTAKAIAARRASSPQSLTDLKKQLMAQKISSNQNAITMPKESKLPSGSTDRYSWKQTDDEVEITVSVEPTVRGKNVKAAFKKDQIAVSVNNEAVITGKLFGTVHPDDCMWSVSGEGSERELSISLEKTPAKVWSSLLQ